MNVPGWRGNVPGRIELDDGRQFVRFTPDSAGVRHQRRCALSVVVRRAREHVARHGYWVLGR